MTDAYPLDLQRVAYSYLERPNRSVVTLLERHILRNKPDATILDVGCGCGVNAGVVRLRFPHARIIGIEPNGVAATAARKVCDEVFNGTLEDWLTSSTPPTIDAVVLSDVLEHVADPVQWLRTAVAVPILARAVWVLSVPNFGVWYNRLRTLTGRFDYAWSGLYDRTHLRFYTRKSIQRLLRYCGLEVVSTRGTASLVQSFAPMLRKAFVRDVSDGNHLALSHSRAFRFYQRFVEPAEELACNAWPSLLAFQIVVVARRPR